MSYFVVDAETGISVDRKDNIQDAKDRAAWMTSYHQRAYTIKPESTPKPSIIINKQSVALGEIEKTILETYGITAYTKEAPDGAVRLTLLTIQSLNTLLRAFRAGNDILAAATNQGLTIYVKQKERMHENTRRIEVVAAICG